MVASVKVRSPPTTICVRDHINLEIEYQGALARDNKDCSDMVGLEKIIGDEFKTWSLQARDAETNEDLMKRLEKWSRERGTRSEAASKVLTSDFISKHPNLANSQILKDRIERQEKRKGLEAREKEKKPSGGKTHDKRSRSRAGGSSRR
ncbi:hypothetical protein BELL_0959g00030 [Botrytis elliptica]|uniref:Uncharacterized protein n=1 Tax=Botrytis elliptica TaxID=278938 RepID=A0A4Z1IYG1_9HELO|nr:hypothetical protein BELL_0959g00030 [Botrytis elliptica]